MSLVNAFINQIGRELGHDAYRSAKNHSSKHIPTASFNDINEDFLNEIKNFELAAYDKVSVRNLINLIEKEENINPKTFNWQECYLELDNKIDFCKAHLDKEHHEKLETLDKNNALNFAVAKERHKTFIAKTTENIQSEITKHENRSTILAFVLSLIGLNPIYYKMNFSKIFGHLFGTTIGVICIYYGYITYAYPTMHNGNLPINTPSELNSIRNIGVAIMIVGSVFYLPVIISSIKRIVSAHKLNSENKETLTTLTTYLEDLNKAK